MLEIRGSEMNEENETNPLERLVMCKFLGTEDTEFQAFIDKMPDKHWSKYDLSAVRLGWEAHKIKPVVKHQSKLSIEAIEVESDWQLVQDYVEDKNWTEANYALARMRETMLKLEAYLFAKKVIST